VVQPVSVQFDLASEHQLAQVLLGTLGKGLPKRRRNTALAYPRQNQRRDRNHSRQQRIHGKKHVFAIFEKLGLETRTAASLRAL